MAADALADVAEATAEAIVNSLKPGHFEAYANGEKVMINYRCHPYRLVVQRAEPGEYDSRSEAQIKRAYAQQTLRVKADLARMRRGPWHILEAGKLPALPKEGVWSCCSLGFWPHEMAATDDVLAGAVEGRPVCRRCLHYLRKELGR